MTASIRFNGVASPNDTYSIGDTVSLANSDNTGASSWLWTLVSKPNGSTASIASSTASSTSFVADVEGAYLVSLVVNGSESDSGVARVVTVHRSLKPLAKGETDEADSTEGWALPWRETYLSIDKALGLGDYRTVVYSGSSGSGPMILITDGTGNLSNGDVVPKCVSGYTENESPVPAIRAARGIFLWESGSIANGQVVKVLAKGLSTLVTNPQFYQTGYNEGVVKGTRLFVSGDPDEGATRGGFSFIDDTTGSTLYPVSVRIGNEQEVGFCIASASDGSGKVRLWWDPFGRNVTDRHGFPGKYNLHYPADWDYNGFIKNSDYQTLKGITNLENIVQNGGFDHWQRPHLQSGTAVINDLTITGSVSAGNFSRPHKLADRWWAVARNGSGADKQVFGFWCKASAEGGSLYASSQNCVRVKNYVTGSSGLEYWVFQEIDRDIVGLLARQHNDLATEYSGGTAVSQGHVSLSVKIRKGSGMSGSIWAGIWTSTDGDVWQNITQYLGSSTEIFRTGLSVVGSPSEWETVGLNSRTFNKVPFGTKKMAVAVYAKYSSDVSASDDDYFEMTDVMVVPGISQPERFVPFGGSALSDRSACEKYYETSYTSASFPGEATAVGSQSGIVLTNSVSPGVRFRHIKAAAHVTASLYDTSGNSGFETVFDGAGQTGTPVQISEKSFRIQQVGATSLEEAIYHYVAEVEL